MVSKQELNNPKSSRREDSFKTRTEVNETDTNITQRPEPTLLASDPMQSETSCTVLPCSVYKRPPLEHCTAEQGTRKLLMGEDRSHVQNEPLAAKDTAQNIVNC